MWKNSRGLNKTSGNDRNFCYECGDALPLPKLEDTAFCFERVEWNRKNKKVSKRKTVEKSKKYARPTSGREMECADRCYRCHVSQFQCLHAPS
uniref:Uncharacterized protein n=1 Tax=Oncorhynchus mykiss TaxID=8022 RepID=A0A8C7RGD9_ONCMY